MALSEVERKLFERIVRDFEDDLPFGQKMSKLDHRIARQAGETSRLPRLRQAGLRAATWQNRFYVWALLRLIDALAFATSPRAVSAVTSALYQVGRVILFAVVVLGLVSLMYLIVFLAMLSPVKATG